MPLPSGTRTDGNPRLLNLGAKVPDNAMALGFALDGSEPGVRSYQLGTTFISALLQVRRNVDG